MVVGVEKLEEVMYGIIRRVPGVSRTQLVKLAYLIDRESYVQNGKTLTRIKYEMYFYGPYCSEFEDALSDLKSKDIIIEDFDGMSYQIYPNKEMDYHLSSEERKIVSERVKFAKNEGLMRSAAAIKRHVYSLPEVDQAEPFKPINFKLIE